MATLVFQLMMLLLANEDNLRTKVTVIGYAQDAKSGAVVIAMDTRLIYHLDGVSHWSEHIVGHEVRVTGRLTFENSTVDESEDIRQGIDGVKRVIKKPKWKILH